MLAKELISIMKTDHVNHQLRKVSAFEKTRLLSADYSFG